MGLIIMYTFYGSIIFSNLSSFTEDYSQLGEVQSLIPTSVHVIALIATAAAPTRAKIIGTLCMDKLHALSVPPHKKNAVYVVKKKSSTEEVIEILARGLKNILPPGPPPKMTE